MTGYSKGNFTNGYDTNNCRKWDCLAKREWSTHVKNDWQGNKSFIESYIKFKFDKSPVITGNNGDGKYEVDYLSGAAAEIGFTGGKIADNSRDDGKQYIFNGAIQAGSYLGGSLSFDATAAYAGSAITQVYGDLGLYSNAKSGIPIEKNWEINKDFKNSDIITNIDAGLKIGTGVRDLKSGIDFNVHAGAEYNYNIKKPKAEEKTVWQGVVLNSGAELGGTHPISNKGNITWKIKGGIEAPLWDTKQNIETFGKDIKQNINPFGEVSFGFSF